MCNVCDKQDESKEGLIIMMNPQLVYVDIIIIRKRKRKSKNPKRTRSKRRGKSSCLYTVWFITSLLGICVKKGKLKYSEHYLKFIQITQITTKLKRNHDFFFYFQAFIVKVKNYTKSHEGIFPSSQFVTSKNKTKTKMQQTTIKENS